MNLHEYQERSNKLWEKISDFINLKDRPAIDRVRKELNRLWLEFELSSSEYELDLEIIANGCCVNCDKIDGKKTTFNNEFTQQSLPYKRCKRKDTGCVCCYSSRIKFDKKDNPVMKKITLYPKSYIVSTNSSNRR